MKNVIMTIGAPGSGKSTWASEQIKKSNSTIVLCRDDLRSMLFGATYKYSKTNEKLVTDTMENMLINALSNDSINSIIIADTNLNQSTRSKFKNIIDHFNNTQFDKPMIELSVQLFDVDWVTLNNRNIKRGDKAVPKDVLRSMYKKMQIYLGKHKQYVPDESKDKAVIFDLDGTLADNNHRGAFEYDKLINDKPITHVVNILKMYEKMGYWIICVSGRNAGDKNDKRKYWYLTYEWLKRHNIPNHMLIMRGASDYRKDDVIKEEIFWNKIEPHYNVECAFDDRDQVVEMWRRIGVPCMQVNFGEF